MGLHRRSNLSLKLQIRRSPSSASLRRTGSTLRSCGLGFGILNSNYKKKLPVVGVDFDVI